MIKSEYSNIDKKAYISRIFHPKLLSTLKGYGFSQLARDASAGIIVGMVALPLAIAFAIASGVSPDRGITTAIIAGLIISAFGGSRVQIGGPTGAFVIIVYKIVQVYGVDGLIICSMMGGVILIAMGLCRFGTLIKFIPYPLTVGFTAGIAMVIFSSEIKDFLGLRIGTVPADFTAKWAMYFHNLSAINPWAIMLSLMSLLIILAWPRISRRIPGPIVAIILATAAAKYWNLPVETIGSRFGPIPTGLPHPALPAVSLARMRELIRPAFTVAMLGAIESLLSATVADSMIDGRHRSNTELIAQGLANIVTPLFGGIPATGAIARTATNVKNGGRTPIAGIIHSLTLLLIVILFGKWANLIPLCVLAAILVIVSYHMSEWRAFRALLRAPRSDIAVLMTTFLLTVFVDLTLAVEVGIFFSLVLFVKRMTDVTKIRDMREELDAEDLERAPSVPPGISIYNAEGAFFFGVAESLRDTFNLGADPPKALILVMRHVLALDASGIRALRDLQNSCAKYGTKLILSGVRTQPYSALKRSGLSDELGLENVRQDALTEAVARAKYVLKS